jgi:hypothetical protein
MATMKRKHRIVGAFIHHRGAPVYNFYQAVGLSDDLAKVL